MVIRYVFAVAIALILAGSRSDAAIITTVNFDSVAPTSIPQTPSSLLIQGFTFSANSGLDASVIAHGLLGAPNSLALIGGSVTISYGSVFSIDQLDVGANGGILSINGIQFGTAFTSGGTLLQDANPLFSGLSSYTITSSVANILLDNIQLSGPAAAVPEPATFALLGLGSIGIILRTRRNRALQAA